MKTKRPLSGQPTTRAKGPQHHTHTLTDATSAMDALVWSPAAAVSFPISAKLNTPSKVHHRHFTTHKRGFYMARLGPSLTASSNAVIATATATATA